MSLKGLEKISVGDCFQTHYKRHNYHAHALQMHSPRYPETCCQYQHQCAADLLLDSMLSNGGPSLVLRVFAQAPDPLPVLVQPEDPVRRTTPRSAISSRATEGADVRRYPDDERYRRQDRVSHTVAERFVHRGREEREAEAGNGAEEGDGGESW